jgi:hypothetical protein
MKIGNEGAIKLAEALKSTTHLTKFELTSSRVWLEVTEYIIRNKEIWREIHECIRTSDLQQLKTLLSKHTINLNSFNLSTHEDTILNTKRKIMLC